MNNLLTKTLSALAILTLISCATTKPKPRYVSVKDASGEPIYLKAPSILNVGAERAEVDGALGKPTASSASNGTTCLAYPIGTDHGVTGGIRRMYYATVSYRNDKAVSWNTNTRNTDCKDH